RVLFRSLVDRRPLATSDPQIQRTQQTTREWLYRQAFHMGRHPIGYEVQKALAAVDWFSQQASGRRQPADASRSPAARTNRRQRELFALHSQSDGGPYEMPGGKAIHE